MKVFTRFLFQDFSLTWISYMNLNKLNTLDIFPGLNKDIIKKLGIENGIPSSMTVFLLEEGGKKMLFDTGYNETRGSELLDRLKEIRISPDDIDYIFITHFHPDHIGGLLDRNDNIVFKKAKVFVAKKEYEEWIYKMSPDKNLLQVKTMKPYEKQLIQFEFNEILPFGIKPIEASGHSPGHTVYQKDKIIFVGDLIHGVALQIEYPDICPKYDMNPEESIKSRKKILEYAKDNKLIMAGCHFPAEECSMFTKFYEQ